LLAECRGAFLKDAPAKKNRCTETIFSRKTLRSAPAYDKKPNSAVAGEPHGIGQLFPRLVVPAVARFPGTIVLQFV
jgi:hypothetical protein